MRSPEERAALYEESARILNVMCETFLVKWGATDDPVNVLKLDEGQAAVYFALIRGRTACENEASRLRQAFNSC